MKKLAKILFMHRWGKISIGLSLAGLLVGCNPINRIRGIGSINSFFTDEQPALSGNGRFLAFISNRDGRRNVMLYDLQQQQYVDTPGLNRNDAIAESPSLSNTSRYIVYLTSDSGRPIIVLYDRATQQSQVITQGYWGWVRNPSISPDGRYIVFETSIRGQWDIELVDRGPNIELDRIDGRPSVPSNSP